MSTGVCLDINLIASLSKNSIMNITVKISLNGILRSSMSWYMNIYMSFKVNPSGVRKL